MSDLHWGNYFWYLFHILSYTYLPSEKNRYIEILKNNVDLLPCPMCIEHYKKMLSKFDLDNNLKSKDDFVYLLNDMHNQVNKRLNKKIYSIDEANKIFLKNGKPIIIHNAIIQYLKIIEQEQEFGADIIQKSILLNTIINICYVFPCEICRKNLEEYLNLNNKIINTKHNGKIIKDMINIISQDND